MFTLSDASKDVKQLIKYAGIFLALLVLSFILIRIFLIVKGIVFPTPPPKATSLFGKLPQQAFPENINNQNFSYSINTLSGILPTMPTITKVYKMQVIKPDLMAVSRFQDKVVSIGYPKNYTVVSDTIFTWKLDSEGIVKTLKGNTITGNFTITSPYLSNKDVLSGKNLPNQDKAINTASDMLTSMNLLSDDLDQSKTKVNLYSIISGRLVPATSPSTTQVFEVDYYQKDIDQIPIYYDTPNSSSINVFVAGGSLKPQIVAANFVHQAPTNDASTYFLKSTTQAFEDLKQGKGYVASYNGASNNISIDNVILAYYISSGPQDFLMPIFVFTGNDNFYAYVWAVKDEWINK
jgi:hypothetical protein